MIMDLIEIVGIEGLMQTTYLAVYPDKLLLLDAGCRSDVAIILNYITNTLGRSLDELKVVMVTHMHPDHAGGVSLLRRKTGCLVVSADKAKPWYQGVQGRVNHLVDIGLAYFVANRQGKRLEYLWYNPILTPDVRVKEGDYIPFFADWQVLETPGHTDRDLSLWHCPSHRIYTADLILKIKTKYVAPYLVTFPEKYKESLIKVMALEPDEVLLAHGERVKLDKQVYLDLIDNTPKEPRTAIHTLINKLFKSKLHAKKFVHLRLM